MDIVKHVTVPLGRDLVWRLWTTSEGLQSWLVESAHVELRLGGPYEILFDRSQPEGRQGSEGCTVLAHIPPRLLSFTWNAPPSLPTRDAEPTFVVVEFEVVDRGTRLTLTHGGWPEAASDPDTPWAETHVYFDRAWSGVMRVLAAYAQA